MTEVVSADYLRIAISSLRVGAPTVPPLLLLDCLRTAGINFDHQLALSVVVEVDRFRAENPGQVETDPDPYPRAPRGGHDRVPQPRRRTMAADEQQTPKKTKNKRKKQKKPRAEANGQMDAPLRRPKDGKTPGQRIDELKSPLRLTGALMPPKGIDLNPPEKRADDRPIGWSTTSWIDSKS